LAKPGERSQYNLPFVASSKRGWIFIVWDIEGHSAMEEETQERVFRNITVALWWAGFDLGFFLLDEPESPDE
jgi:hypothetical protein